MLLLLLWLLMKDRLINSEVLIKSLSGDPLGMKMYFVSDCKESVVKQPSLLIIHVGHLYFELMLARRSRGRRHQDSVHRAALPKCRAASTKPVF